MNNYQQAAQIIKDSRFAEDAINTKDIAWVIERYVDELIEDINNDPEDFFKDNYRFWRELDKVVLSEGQVAIAQKTSRLAERQSL